VRQTTPPRPLEQQGQVEQAWVMNITAGS